MNKLHLAAALLAAAIATPTFAQNVQDKTEPQNPKDVTPASPSNQGATDGLKNPTGNSAQGQQTGAADQSQHGKRHKKSMHHKKETDGSSASSTKQQQ